MKNIFDARDPHLLQSGEESDELLEQKLPVIEWVRGLYGGLKKRIRIVEEAAFFDRLVEVVQQRERGDSVGWRSGLVRKQSVQRGGESPEGSASELAGERRSAKASRESHSTHCLELIQHSA